MRAISQRKVFPVNNNKRLLLQSALPLAAPPAFWPGPMAQNKPTKRAGAAGHLDANSYPQKPYLGAQVADGVYKVVAVGFPVNFPIGLYSKKVKKLEDLKEGAKFGIPNDPTNGGRVLLVLQDKGLIKLREGAGLKATPLDVVSNPKKLKFVELDAAQLPRSLDDLDASAINTNFALSAGLNPGKDAIAQENAKSPYV